MMVGKSCKMQAKQDYSTAVLHMVSLLQEKYGTVQRLFRIECNTTFRIKDKQKKPQNIKTLLYVLGYLEKTDTHFLSSPGAPRNICVH